MCHLFAEMNKGKEVAMVAIDELMSTDFVYHCALGKEIRGAENYKKNVIELFSVFPDAHFTIDDLVAEGDKVVSRWTLTGTYRGAFGDVPTTNNKVMVWGITIDRIIGGKFVEEWERYDTLGFTQQLEAISARAKQG